MQRKISSSLNDYVFNILFTLLLILISRRNDSSTNDFVFKPSPSPLPLGTPSPNASPPSAPPNLTHSNFQGLTSMLPSVPLMPRVGQQTYSKNITTGCFKNVKHFTYSGFVSMCSMLRR